MKRVVELPENHIYARTRQDWRKWLQQNHSDQAEVWLVYFKKNSGTASVVYNEAVEEALCYGWIDGIRKRIDEKRFMQRYTPRREKSQWSESNRQRVTRLIEQGIMEESGLACIEAAKAFGTWDNAPPARPSGQIAPQFKAALDGNQQAAAFFKQLAPTQQKHYCMWINEAKRESTRQGRIDEAIEKLLRNEPLGLK